MKWGILATGTIARKFADTVRAMESEGEFLEAAASRRLESAQNFAKEFGAKRLTVLTMSCCRIRR